MADDDDEEVKALYENGHWVWCTVADTLVYVSDLPASLVETIQVKPKAPTGTIQFREMDPLDQLRFRRRYQRKIKLGQADVITIQDVKDIAIYTAPTSLLSSRLIKMLHLPTTDRFLRALVLYCQYYLQIADQMALRIVEEQTKVRTPVCEVIETKFRENLCDLRLLVAKEYSLILLGGADTRNFHHMGPNKKGKSLSYKDAIIFESLLRVIVEIVWLALGRSSFNQIELEIHRLFKTEIYNSVEHNLRTGYVSKMIKEEKSTLFGKCLQRDTKVNTKSPIMNELFCDRLMDYRALGLGVIEFPTLTTRLKYMCLAVMGPEENYASLKVTVGLLGMIRSEFDTTLRPIPIVTLTTGSKHKTRSSITKSKGSTRSITTRCNVPDILLPEKSYKDFDNLPETFPTNSHSTNRANETQRRIWLTRYSKLINSKVSISVSTRTNQ